MFPDAANEIVAWVFSATATTEVGELGAVGELGILYEYRIDVNDSKLYVIKKTSGVRSPEVFC